VSSQAVWALASGGSEGAFLVSKIYFFSNLKRIREKIIKSTKEIQHIDIPTRKRRKRLTVEIRGSEPK
jgi:hypothetical protein